MPDSKDVMESDEALLFLIWIFMSTMIGTVPCRSHAHDILSIYDDELVGLWSLPILMTLGRCQYSRFDPLRMWNKDPRQETH
jgi:phosphatidylglycerophosphatase A